MVLKHLAVEPYISWSSFSSSLPLHIFPLEITARERWNSSFFFFFPLKLLVPRKYLNFLAKFADWVPVHIYSALHGECDFISILLISFMIFCVARMDVKSSVDRKLELYYCIHGVSSRTAGVHIWFLLNMYNALVWSF